MHRGMFFALLLLAIYHRLSPSLRPTSPLDKSPQAPPWHHNPCCIEAIFAGSYRKSATLLKPSHLNRSLSLFAILLSGDMHCNPGPNNDVCMCGFCDQPVTWNCKGICCDSCDIWFHHSCVDVGSAEYDAISRPTVAWKCPRCDSMNCDSFTFHSYEINTTNFFSPLQNLSSIDSISSIDPFSPQRTSSPKTSSSPSSTNSTSQPNPLRTKSRSTLSSVFKVPKKSNLRILNVNCQDVAAKKQALDTVLQEPVL